MLDLRPSYNKIIQILLFTNPNRNAKINYVQKEQKYTTVSCTRYVDIILVNKTCGLAKIGEVRAPFSSEEILRKTKNKQNFETAFK